ncbi:hypothetical protein A33Q_3274 [Indibacter alkaliphilus LW1]|uniref:Acyl carrier protein n=1 Tax=Indibacter alkaliphilus (strain CCUG 57479 / KCTC 22604 / LW1) TaxID=1189612 RepID=S2D8V5_INDAL|nr:hypothetical protein [Indibacter alkaliphilus]EOZ95354.1 hypothetical protein A33Q_3274 [Indibacter alkaliphilus LW1]
MKNIAELKKAISVFRAYGITLTGKRKTANFYAELGMEWVFVNGLIYELELELKREILEEKAKEIQTPSEAIQTLLSA